MLYLYSNHLEGSIPYSIWNLYKLQQLSLFFNMLTGSLPSSISNLDRLELFALDSNQMTGTIPFSIGQLSFMRSLMLYTNLFSGSIPPSIGNLSLLETFWIFSNQITGTIPSSIGNLTGLLTVDLNSNSLSGSIPSSIGYLINMLGLGLYSNRLTGNIHSSIGNLTQLDLLSLFSNHLTGKIPNELGNLQAMNYLYLSNNLLTGCVPPSIGSMKKIQNLFFGDNLSTGDVPSLAACSQLTSLGFGSSKLHLSAALFPSGLQYLDISNNGLTNVTLVTTLLQRDFSYLDLSSNAFSASLPLNIWNTTVAKVYLNGNRFYGSFPALGDRVCSMQYVTISGNLMTGTLPMELSQCVNMTAFYASDMYLTGPVKGRFFTQPLLQTLVLANNSLTGSIEDVFAGSDMTGLILNMAYNALTGSLPVSSLETGRYQSLILLSNCLSGTLPGEALCANENMTELLLSGLHSSSACRSSPLSFLSGLGVSVSYVETNKIGGTLPGCLLSSRMAQLSYLTLSGNMLKGSIPREVTVNATLQGLDLSHNELTGTIPASIVEASLSLLDLSFNRFAGTISSSASGYYAVSTGTKVSLEVNQLSGTLPASWMEAINIDVLNGNMFACEVGSMARTANLPKNDKMAATYACGSSVTDVSLMAVIITLLIVLGVYIISVCWVSKSLIRNCMDTLAQTVNTCQRWLGKVLYGIQVGCVYLILIVSLVLYAVLTVATSAYSYTYVWVVSLSLQQGTVAGSVLFVWICMMCVWLNDCVEINATNTLIIRVKQSGEEWSRVVGNLSLKLQACLVLLVMHILPVFGVNIAYVYTTTLQLSVTHRAVIVLGMSLFKLAWNALVGKVLSGYKRFRHMSFWFNALPFVGVINLILIPTVTEMIVSSNCFWYLLSPIPTDSYIVEGGTCYWITYTSNGMGGMSDVVCMTHNELESKYNSGSVSTETGNYNMIILSTTTNGQGAEVDFAAGFAYNYQCAFSLLQAFAFVYVYKYLCRVLLLPLLWFGLKRLRNYSYDRFGLSSRWFQLANGCLPPLMKLLLDTEVDVEKEGRLEEVKNYNSIILQDWQDNDQILMSSKLLRMRLILDIAMTMSFGLLFPLLGMLALAAVLVDVCTTHWMVQRMGGYGSHMTQSKHSKKVSLVEQGENECEAHIAQVQGAVEAFRVAYMEEIRTMPSVLPWLLCFATVTWSLALYDVVGREEGAIRGLWVLIATLTMPWWTWGMVKAYHKGKIRWTSGRMESALEGETSGEGRDVELVKNPLRRRE